MEVTPSAVKKVKEIIAEYEEDKLGLRISVKGGGCSGFQYGFSFDEKINDDDFVVTKNTGSADEKVSLLVDAMSYQYLSGAEIDYQKGLEGEQFVIRNPNAKTTCGCGSSFSA